MVKNSEIRNKEIERKWLLSGFPTNLYLTGEYNVAQYYLYVNDEVEIRITKKINTEDSEDIGYKLTIKMGEGIERTEVESKLTRAAFYNFVASVTKNPIRKLYRTYLGANGEEICVSMVDGEWFYGEVEFNSLDEALAYKPCFGFIKEATEDIKYAMKNYWRFDH